MLLMTPADQLRERDVKLALGRTLYDPGNLTGKMFFNIHATFAELFSVSRPTVHRTLRPPPFPLAYDPVPTGIDLD